MTARSWRNEALAAVSVAALFVAFLVVRYRFDSPDIADFPAYAYFTDVYWAGFDRSWLFSEPLGWGMLLVLRNLTGSTDGAIQVAHWLLGISTPLLLLYIARHFNIAWQGTIVVVALFGPLLAMVTIRATPAYLLCVVAALLASRGRFASIGLVVLAILFHNSAALTLVPVALILLQRRYPSLARPFESRIAIISIAAVLSLAMLYFRTELFQFIQTIIAQTPGSIQKYLVYFAVGSAEGGNVNQAGQDATFHILFLAGASIVLISYILLSKDEQIPFLLFAISSFVIFLLLNINPVTAYRQSLYWIIPLLFTFPWSRLHPRIFFSIIIFFISIALFSFNLLGVVL